MLHKYKKYVYCSLLIDPNIIKGVLLFLSMLSAIFISNSHYKEIYFELFNTNLPISIGGKSLQLTFRDWINDLLMAIFFFTIGIEIKRELFIGYLSTKEQRILPVIAAISGVLAPAFLFILCNRAYDLNIKGWAIPTATDIAFVLGVVALFAKNIPIFLKVFLTALAIIDDLIAILIIAFYYTENLQLHYLWYASFCIVLLRFFNSAKINIILILGMMLWYYIMASGIHATISGVILGLLMPISTQKESDAIKSIEEGLHPFIYYVILPLFAFANSGFNFAGVKWSIFQEPIVFGIVIGLFLGKQLGIFSAVFFMVRLKICTIPENITLTQFYAISIICGIGFTMSLLIGILAFRDTPGATDYGMLVKIGVLSGSLLSFIFGLIILRFTELQKK